MHYLWCSENVFVPMVQDSGWTGSSQEMFGKFLLRSVGVIVLRVEMFDDTVALVDLGQGLLYTEGSRNRLLYIALLI